MASWRHLIKLVSFVSASLLLATLPALAAAGCDLSEIKSSAKLNDALGRRAVEAVQLASQAGYRKNDRLSQLIEPSATFDLGAGDVGRPLGQGIEGIRSLVEAMHANSFRFYGWDFMDMPVDGCSTQRVSVDFVDASAKQSSIVEFTFVEGRVVSGKGWVRSFESGSLNPIESRN